MNAKKFAQLPLIALSSSLITPALVLAEEEKAPPAPVITVSKPAPKVAFTVPDPVAIVNGVVIPKATFDQYTQQMRGRGRGDSPEGAKALIDQLVLEELLVQEAATQKLADDPQVKQQIQMIQRNVLASTIIRRMISATPPKDEDIKKEYETMTASMRGKEFKASHILVDAEDKAKAIIEELQKGAPFAELAKTKSTDSSAQNGGDLGWFSSGMMVPQFSEAVEKLEKGKYTDKPVQSPFGWHVILLEDSREATPPPLDELKPQIVQTLQGKVVNGYLEKLKAAAKVEVKEIQVTTPPVAPEAPQAASEEKTEEAAATPDTEEKKDDAAGEEKK